MADVNSTEYAKLVASVQTNLTPFERGGRMRVATANALTTTSPPSASEFLYLTKIPNGAKIVGVLYDYDSAFLAANGTATVEVETSEGTYTSISRALSMDGAAGGGVDFSGSGTTANGGAQGAKVRLNPATAGFSASKTGRFSIVYVVD